jgi:glycosyltransferase involved in cell wall biosynthesis
MGFGIVDGRIDRVERRKMLLLVSSDTTVRYFLLRHIQALSEDFDVTVSANCAASDLVPRLAVGTTFVENGVVRPIHVLADIREVWRLARSFRQRRFWAVHTFTPKAGLLGMCAARLARVPVRVHTFSGQVWATRTGLMRWVLKSLDRVTARCATLVIVDGRPQLAFLIDESVLRQGEALVLANGSIAGVDIERFRPDAERRVLMRRNLGIATDSVVCLFVGRLNVDKGVLDLARAFAKVRASYPKAVLVVTGVDEEGLAPQMRALAGEHRSAMHIVGAVDQPEHYMAMADLFCLPSRREGFAVSVLEAASSGLPAVVAGVYGLADTIVDGVTGRFHTVGDADDLARKLEAMIESPETRNAFGAAARQRAEREFSAELVTRELVALYRRTALSDEQATPSG